MIYFLRTGPRSRALPLLGLGLTLLSACGDSTNTTTAATTDTDASTSDTDATATDPSTTAGTSSSSDSSGTESSTGSTDATTDATSDPTTDATDPTTDATDPTTDTTNTTDPTDTTDTTGVPSGECEGADDCQLVNNCCECAAHPADDPIAPCDQNCFQPSCEAIGLFAAEAACRLGVCSIAAVSCDQGTVVCNVPPPDCGELIPSVVDGCWGGCVAPRFCDVLPSCSHALCGDGWMCVESQAGVFPPHCEPAPLDCEGPPDCACATPEFSEVCQGGCSDDGDSLLCVDGG
ncbi:MAG: hypothetical protein R3A51_08095 [Nannocystaceae bacterium]|nr:hypothetical protein [Myxococcales bacterium]